jgi:hypothetical protein
LAKAKRRKNIQDECPRIVAPRIPWRDIIRGAPYLDDAHWRAGFILRPVLANPREVMDGPFIQELDKSGYIDGLY